MKALPHIFIIDDNPCDTIVIAKIIRSILRNCEVNTFLNGDLAIKHLYENIDVPDLILLDVQMPSKSGLEILAILKNDEELAAIPIVLLSGLALSEFAEEGLKAHANLILHKPSNLPELEKELSYVCYLLLGEKFSPTTNIVHTLDKAPKGVKVLR